MAAAAGSTVVLTPWWSGEGPEPGDVLESRTLRRWQLLSIEQGSSGPRFRCRVMAPDEEHPPGAVRWLWIWPKRGRRPRS